MTTLFFFLSFYVLATENTLSADDAAAMGVAGTDEAANLLQDYLSKYKYLSASFTQTTFDRDDRVVQKMQGRLWVSSPDRFRIETVEPDKQILVSDGKQFWNYDVDLEQVIVSKLDASRIPVLLLAKSEKEITDSYAVNGFNDETSAIFVLSPRDENSMFASLNIEFVDSQLAALMVRDKMGQATHVRFDDLKAPGDSQGNIFNFDAPDDVDVIYED